MRANALRGGTARVIGRGTVRGILYDLGDYPGLVDGSETDRVAGLLLELSDAGALALLDRYEGVEEGLYARRTVAVGLDDGGTSDAWVYFYARSVASRRRITAWPT